MLKKNDYYVPRKRNSKKALFGYQSKSGTGIAYQYAVKEKRKIINAAEC